MAHFSADRLSTKQVLINCTLAMEQLSEKLLADEADDIVPGDMAVSSTIREGLFQDDTAAIATKTVPKHYIPPKARHFSKQNWHLIATPLLTISVLVLFLATGPGTVGTFDNV